MKRLFAALLLSMGLLVPGIVLANTPIYNPQVVVDCAMGYHVQPGTTSCVPNDLSASATTGNAPLSVSFSSGYPGTVDFGDGSTGGLNPAPTCASCAAQYIASHVYAASGSYTARLQNVSGGPTVTISVGGLAQKPRPTCRIIALQNSPGVGATVNISWASTNATGGTITTIGSVGPSGTQGVIPLAPATTYTGTFTGAGGTGTCSITIAVLSTGGYGVTGSIGDVGAVPEVGDGLFYVPTYDATVPAPITTPKPPTTLTGPGGPGSTLNTSGGLVSCGGTGDCNICTLSSTVQNLLNFALGLSIPIAAGMFAYAGWLYFSNAESEDKIKRAKRIFRDTLIGFCIALMAWLAVQTILKALAPGYSGWNSFQCNNLTRPGSTLGNSSDLNKVLNGDVGAPQQAPLAVVTVPQQNQAYANGVLYDDQTGCANGSAWNSSLSLCCVDGGECLPPIGAAINGTYSKPTDYTTCDPGDRYQSGQCWTVNNETGQMDTYDPYATTNARSGPEGSCPAGYAYTEGGGDIAGSAWCQNPQDPTDVADFLSTKAGGQLVQCNGGTCSSIAAAAQAYYGQNTSSGPDGGNKACAWSVNNVLASAGVAPIDGDSVANMEGILQSGRGTLVGSDQNTSGTQAGDIVVWKSSTYSHVGICLDNGCSQVLSNSSSNASFTSVTPPNFNGNWSARIYHVNN